MKVNSSSSKITARLAHSWLQENASSIPDDSGLGWCDWLTKKFPDWVSVGGKPEFGPHHQEFWEWVWSIENGGSVPPFIAVWPRGGGKSTSCELACASLMMRQRRSYILYVRSTQSRADDSVGNIAALLEEAGEERSMNRFGQSRGWRRNRIRTVNSGTIDGLGLDVAARGIKLERHRPDAIILDDLDDRFDSMHATQKKIETITDSLLPAGSSNTIVGGVQNLIIPNGIFSRLADGRADFLSGRIVSGPHPAIKNLTVEKQAQPDGSLRSMIDGEPTWEGQDLQACQRIVDRIGLSSFIRECQHQVAEREGALLTRDTFNVTRVGGAPEMVRVVIGVDPSGGSEEIGIVVVGKGRDGHGYTLADRTTKGSLGPLYWASEVGRAYEEFGADKVVAEGNFGGNMVVSNLKMAQPDLPVKLVSASRGKQVRAEPVATLFQDRRAHHVGGFDGLETEWTSWVPGDPDSPNALDAEVWALSELFDGATPTPALYHSDSVFGDI